MGTAVGICDGAITDIKDTIGLVALYGMPTEFAAAYNNEAANVGSA